MPELKLKKTIFVNGAEIGSLPYDFDAMTAIDKLSVSRRMVDSGFAVSSAEELDPCYHLFLFARAVEVATKGKDEAGRVTVEDVLRLSAKDAQRAGELARDFFYLSR